MGKSRYKKKSIPKPSELDVASRVLWCFLEGVVIFGAVWALLPASLFENVGAIVTPLSIVISAILASTVMFWGRFSILLAVGAIALFVLMPGSHWHGPDGSGNRQKRNR